MEYGTLFTPEMAESRGDEELWLGAHCSIVLELIKSNPVVSFLTFLLLLSTLNQRSINSKLEDKI